MLALPDALIVRTVVQAATLKTNALAAMTGCADEKSVADPKKRTDIEPTSDANVENTTHRPCQHARENSSRRRIRAAMIERECERVTMACRPLSRVMRRS
jgi:hypothetical protein